MKTLYHEMGRTKNTEMMKSTTSSISIAKSHLSKNSIEFSCIFLLFLQKQSATRLMTSHLLVHYYAAKKF